MRIRELEEVEMRVECGIKDGKVQVPRSWLDKWKQETGEEPDTVVFDLSDASAKVPAGVFPAVREPSYTQRKAGQQGITRNTIRLSS